MKVNYGFPLSSTMALQQAQTLLSMNSLESVNVGVQQNNTESFAVVLCHLAELHAEQVSLIVNCPKNVCRDKWGCFTGLWQAE